MRALRLTVLQPLEQVEIRLYFVLITSNSTPHMPHCFLSFSSLNLSWQDREQK
jgi:hypothetical protein